MAFRICRGTLYTQQALLVLLKQKSLEDLSMAELCRIAEINRGPFYLHYKNVHAVFERYFNDDKQTPKQLNELLMKPLKLKHFDLTC